VGGVFGILGDARREELAAMAERLAHRGSPAQIWSPAPGVHLGQLGPDLDPERRLAWDGHLHQVPGPSGRPTFVPGAPVAARLAELLRARGAEAAQSLHGQFALAWWDEGRDTLVLARDPFGARPLYATRSRGRFAFASEYKALLALGDVAALPDRDAIQHLQCTRYPRPDATFLLEVAPVARCAATEVTPASERVLAFPRVRAPLARRTDAEHVAALRRAFLDALRLRIEGVDPLGVQLSGGFDSSLVLAGVRALRPTALVHTFTAGFGADDPEARDARALAAELGAQHHELVLEPEQLPALLPSTVWHMEDPYGREDQVYLYVLAREAARHVKLLLAGYGADLMLGGMPRHRLVYWALRFPPARAPLAELYRFTQTGLPARGALGRLAVALLTRGRDVPVPRVRGTRYEPGSSALRREGPQPFASFLARALEEDSGWEALETEHAASGLRFDAPFMDPEFASVAFSLPDRLRIRRGMQKHALREAARGLLPPEVLARRKTLQRLRHDARLADTLEELADRWLSRADVLARGLFEPSDVERLRRRRPGAAYPEAQAHRLWTLLTSELWCRIFLDARGKSPI
jgi:asparagine synthase (glutamine-hydrolysing)